jgi:preprotein translocase subunit Sss1
MSDQRDDYKAFWEKYSDKPQVEVNTENNKDVAKVSVTAKKPNYYRDEYKQSIFILGTIPFLIVGGIIALCPALACFLFFVIVFVYIIFFLDWPSSNANVNIITVINQNSSNCNTTINCNDRYPH